AMACGTPVIAYPHGSVPEVLEEDVTGFLVSDTRAGAKAVEKIPYFNRQLCREVFEERFSATRMADDYLAVYERLVRGESTSLALTEGAFSWMKLSSSPSSTT
ncbi:MAG TPA: glycosyltransferase, partial [Candidatus Kapabacteria bacterium]|nr:glycosyltransferase [Candidatus Kapabacteria bacterium]